MTLTRANLEAITVKRCGPLMTEAGMATTVLGENADLNDPIGYAIRRLGYSTTDPTAVADADVAGVAVADYDKLLDVVEWRTLRTILHNLDDVDLRTSTRSESYDQLARRVERMVVRLDKYIKNEYGIGVELEGGMITLAFQEQNEEED